MTPMHFGFNQTHSSINFSFFLFFSMPIPLSMEDKKHFPLAFKLMVVVLFLLLHCVCFCTAVAGSSGGKKGKWQLLLNNTGVVGMHMALTHHGTVIIFDQIGVGQSGYGLPWCCAIPLRRFYLGVYSQNLHLCYRRSLDLK
ncbi:unnamed protein product, partial [Vitis vinifera]